MAKREISYADHLDKVFEIMSTYGILIVSNDKQGKANPMTIGWGTVGVIWGRPVFLALVRHSRYTFSCLEHTGDFTINVAPPEMKDIVEYCGSVSGRNHDKVAEKGLTLLRAEKVSSPLIQECVLHYECRVIHKHDLAPETLAREIIPQYYPSDDFHRVYYGQILRAVAEEQLHWSGKHEVC